MAIEPTDSPSVRTLDLATGVTATHGSAASPWTLPIARDGGTILAYRNDGIVAIQPGNDPTLVVAHTDLLNWPLGVDRTGRRIFYARGKDSSGPSDFRLLDRQAGTDISIAQEWMTGARP
mgnify:FL=1